MTDVVLHEKLVLLKNNGIIEKVIIEKHKITEGYAISNYGISAVNSYLAMVQWGINHNKMIRGKKNKS